MAPVFQTIKNSGSKVLGNGFKDLLKNPAVAIVTASAGIILCFSAPIALQRASEALTPVTLPKDAIIAMDSCRNAFKLYGPELMDPKEKLLDKRDIITGQYVKDTGKNIPIEYMPDVSRLAEDGSDICNIFDQPTLPKAQWTQWVSAPQGAQ